MIWWRRLLLSSASGSQRESTTESLSMAKVRSIASLCIEQNQNALFYAENACKVVDVYAVPQISSVSAYITQF